MRVWRVFDINVLKDLPGFLVFKVEGKKSNIFKKESGTHRWQRVPPTEKRGRVHTSAVTVAVLENEQDTTIEMDMKDVDIRAYKASGKGGQHRNKTMSAIEVKHIPTGIKAQCTSERAQSDNKSKALELLRERLQELNTSSHNNQRVAERRDQVGYGLRSEKVQTVQEQNDQVVNHISGKRITCKQYFKGRIDLLHGE